MKRDDVGRRMFFPPPQSFEKLRAGRVANAAEVCCFETQPTLERRPRGHEKSGHRAVRGLEGNRFRDWRRLLPQRRSRTAFGCYSPTVLPQGSLPDTTIGDGLKHSYSSSLLHWYAIKWTITAKGILLRGNKFSGGGFEILYVCYSVCGRTFEPLVGCTRRL